MKLKFLTPILTAICATQLHATILVNETFIDGDPDTDNLPTSLNWVTGAHHTTSTSAYTNLSVTGNVMTWDHTISSTVNSYSGIFGYFTNSGSPLVLNVGETLRLTFTAAFSDPSSNTVAGAFRYALLNSGGSRVTTDFAGTNATGLSNGSIFTNWRGYEGQTAISTTAVTAAGTGAVSRQRDAASPTSALFTSANWNNVGASSVASDPVVANEAKNGFLEITRTSTGVIVQSGFGSAITPAILDTSGPYFTFDTISFFTLDNGNDILLSNIKLELIPEPSSALLAAAGAGLLVTRRRRQK